MSSIAYVTDEEMLEYHRLCCNKTMLFWRLTEHKNFKNFHHGDLLFFYAKPYRAKRKALIGYAHFDSIKRLSYKNIYKNYGETTGYASAERFHDAVEKAAKGKIPEKMSCLYLTDVVFFLSPIFPNEIGIDIPTKLESYQYLDREDTDVTVRILKVAEKHGLDLWSTDPNVSKDEIFRHDMIRQQIASISHAMGKDTRNEKQKALCRKLMKENVTNKNIEYIKNSETDCISIEKDKIHIYIPFVAQSNDVDKRVLELYGKVYMYRIKSRSFDFHRDVKIHIIHNSENKQVKELVNEINHVGL